MLLKYMICLLIGYLCGTSNMAFYISKIKGVDLRSGGSGNLGASNATMLMGKGAGALTFLHDALKVMLAVWICRLMFGNLQYLVVITATASVLGHMYPFYLGFKGGKGFASYIGMGFALNWKFGLLMLLGLVVVAFVADWIVAGTFFHITITPIYLFIHDNWLATLIVLIASVCIFYKHIENIKRKAKNQEPSIRNVLFKMNKNKDQT
jgi:glycerol-3-phosphate acyltransferase PlsY